MRFDPPERFWAFNPSIVRMPDHRLLCAVRCASYHRTMGKRLPRVIQNRNFLLEIDPQTLATRSATEILESPAVAALSRKPASVSGFDDLRITHTKADGLVAIANTAEFFNGTKREIAVLDLDPQTFQITAVQILRGEAWSKGHQKNWTPFVGTPELRLVYSIERGGIHRRDGRISTPCWIERYKLRGGSQLVAAKNLGWLGIAHGVTDAGSARRDYWHMFHLSDQMGRVLAYSSAFKLTEHPIEFAAGLVIDPTCGRVVISYGVEDDRAMFGVTDLDSVLGTLRPVARSTS